MNCVGAVPYDSNRNEITGQVFSVAVNPHQALENSGFGLSKSKDESEATKPGETVKAVDIFNLDHNGNIMNGIYSIIM